MQCDAFMKRPDDSPVLKVFSCLGEMDIPSELDEDKLPADVAALEEFVCNVYSENGPKTLSELRWELFRAKNSEGEMLSPTLGALLPHTIRANFISRRDKSYTAVRPLLPPIEENGWNLQDGVYTPIMCTLLPAPKAVIELTKCGCKKTACIGNCNCFKNTLPCTPMCKCNVEMCQNSTVSSSNPHTTDSDEEDNYD